MNSCRYISKMWQAWWPLVLFTAAWLWSSSAAWNVNDKAPLSNWRSDMWADASGYYVYMPGLVHHGMRATGWPDSTPERFGHGFQLDTISDRVLTKYTAGPAILLFPFYLFAEALTQGSSIDGLTTSHRRLMEVGAAFYWSLAITLLTLAFLRKWPAPAWVPMVAIALTCWGSNVIYYVIRMPLYSHVYSFFCVSLALWSLLSGLDGTKSGLKRFVFHASCAMIIVIRPVDVIAVIGLYIWIWFERPQLLAKPLFWIAQAAVMLLFAFPQMVYWKFAHGDWLIYSYGGEGFTEWQTPHFTELLFAPGNGWIPNAPAVLLLPFGLWSAYRVQKWTPWLIGGILAAIIYVCASWHQWHFGCSYGARPLVQYMPFVAITLHLFLSFKDPLTRRWHYALLPIFLILAFATYRLALQYDICYAWEHTSWRYFIRNVLLAFFGKSEF